MITQTEKRKRHTRFLLAGMVLGMTLAFLLLSIVNIAKANATPDSDALRICGSINMQPTMKNIDQIASDLLEMGYGTKGAAAEMEYAISTYCPQNAAILEQWRVTPTGPNGTVTGVTA